MLFHSSIFIIPPFTFLSSFPFVLSFSPLRFVASLALFPIRRPCVTPNQSPVGRSLFPSRCKVFFPEGWDNGSGERSWRYIRLKDAVFSSDRAGALSCSKPTLPVSSQFLRFCTTSVTKQEFFPFSCCIFATNRHQ